MKFVILMFIYIANLFANETVKIALIDTGVNLTKKTESILYFNKYKNCNYNFLVETKENCLSKDLDEDSHGTEVFNILTKNVDKNSVLSYIYASPEDSLKLINLLKFPTNSREVYIKKEILKQQSRYIAESIEMAAANNVSIINISLGDRGFYTNELEDSIKNHPEILFVFGAGNNGSNLNISYNKIYPCSLKMKNTICVGSLKNKKIADYSNYGKDVDIYVEPKDEGTSFAAPIIANKAYFLFKKYHDVSKIIQLLKLSSSFK